MLRFVAVFLAVAGCNSVLGLGDFTDEEDTAPSVSGSNAGGGPMSASTGQAGASFGGHGGSAVAGGGGQGGMPSSAKKVVFVTGAAFPPSQIASVSSANSLCAAVAGAGDLEGTYQAWVSDNTMTAAANVTGQGPWYRVDGPPVFATRADLLAMNSSPVSAIVITEAGAQLALLDRVWTGTVDGGGKGNVCESGTDDWVDDGSALGTSGIIGQPTYWTAADQQSCNSPCHSYCFEL